MLLKIILTFETEKEYVEGREETKFIYILGEIKHYLVPRVGSYIKLTTKSKTFLWKSTFQ